MGYLRTIGSAVSTEPTRRAGTCPGACLLSLLENHDAGGVKAGFYSRPRII